MKRKILMILGIMAIVFFIASGSYVLDKFLTPVFENNAFAHVSENTPLGLVATAPQDLGNGIYLIKVKVGFAGKNPVIYPAITAHPEDFPVGSMAKLKNITVSGTNTFGDMFHQAIKP